MSAIDFGSLNQVLQQSSAARNLASWDRNLVSASHLGETLNLLDSAGPVSDAYIMASDPVMVIEGPVGSGKTVASVKKGLFSAQRMVPTARAPDDRPLRRYVLSIWREKYDDLWRSTIPSWWTVFPKDLAGSQWVGARPRSAQHTIAFEDQWGPVMMLANFMAFGEQANPEDLRGTQYTDAWLNEIDTMPELLFTYLVGRVGRDPPPEVMKRAGRIFGDQNPPDVLAWTYRDLHEFPKDGYQLFRQPGGRHPDAENRRASGPGYYANQAKVNANKPWYVKRMVDGIPGLTRGVDLVYDKYDDETMYSATPLELYPALPVLVGTDGGMTPAAAYAQETSDGQGRTLAEIALERGGMEELATAMLALEARIFPRCEFHTVCDPSMLAGEDDVVKSAGGTLEVREGIQRGSDRQKLAKLLGRKVHEAQTNVPNRRYGAVREKMAKNLGPGRPGYIMDPSCKTLRRGKLQTYHFLKQRGTNDLSRVAKTFDGHVTEAEQYAYLEMGTALARKRQTDLKREREERLKEGRQKARRYSPLGRRG